MPQLGYKGLSQNGERERERERVGVRYRVFAYASPKGTRIISYGDDFRPQKRMLKIYEAGREEQSPSQNVHTVRDIYRGMNNSEELVSYVHTFYYPD
jgi:hypothetical protein